MTNIKTTIEDADLGSVTGATAAGMAKRAVVNFTTSAVTGAGILAGMAGISKVMDYFSGKK